MKYAGLIGSPVKHSLSPQMQNAAFASLGIEAEYELWETPLPELEARIQSLRSPHFLGANVTIPHKEAVLPWLDECDPQAARIGAVNTIVNRLGRLFGYNTDAPGFLRALTEHLPPPADLRGKQVVFLGNGGAARAAAIALLDSQIRLLTVLGRDLENLYTFQEELGAQSDASRLQSALFQSESARQILSEADILVNTTSVGLQANDQTLLIDIESLASSTLVMDMIFNPPLTPLLRAAQARGCSVLNGLSMLLYQGTLAFEHWTGQDAPEDVMRAALGLK